MTIRRPARFSLLLFAGSTLFLAANGGLAAESYRLNPAPRAGHATRVEFAMEVGGDVSLVEKSEKANSKAAIKKVPMSVAATLVYDERLLSDDGKGQLWARFYDQATATIKLDKGGQRPVLSEQRRLLALHRGTAKPVIWAPGSLLTREELDLVDSPANSVLLEDLLPDQKVQVGATWDHSDLLIASLLGIDTVDVNKTKSSLLEVRDNQAKLALNGAVHGSVGGVGTELEIKAKYNFDLKSRRIVWYAMAVKEKRAIGHVGPGLDVTAKVTIKLAPLAASDQLNDEVVARIDAPPTAADLLVDYESPNKSFHLKHDRRWFVTGEHDELTVMRMVDHGELVAQCNISPTAHVSPDQPPALDQFQKDIELALGKHFDAFANARESLDDEGRRVLRVVANGAVSEVPIEWIYYLITDKSGRQATLGFTLEHDLAKQFGAADQDMARGLSLTPPAVETAQQPTPAETTK